MKANGFLVSQQEKSENGIQYFGIDTNAWPIGEDELAEVYNKSQLHRLYALLDETDWEDQACFLFDLDMIIPYIKYCNENNITNRVLYIETDEECAVLDCDLQKRWAIQSNFIGYDVGYCTSFECYSSLLSDVIHRPNLFPDLFKRLNLYGLLSYTDALLYTKARESMKQEHQSTMFEFGRMYRFAIYKVDLTNLLVDTPRTKI